MDGFNSKEKNEYTKKEVEILKKFNHGWAVESLETPKFFIEESKKLGFIDQKYTNITDKTIKTSIILYLASFPAYIVVFFGKLLRLKTKYGVGNVVGARYQYLGMKKKLWEYGMFITKK